MAESPCTVRWRIYEPIYMWISNLKKYLPLKHWSELKNSGVARFSGARGEKT